MLSQEELKYKINIEQGTSIKTLHHLYKLTLEISEEGSIADVGVWKGASAKAMCLAKDERTLHLFDTFKGMPNDFTRYDDRRRFEVGSYFGSLEEVKSNLSGFPNLVFHEGLIHDTLKEVKGESFCLVFLDLDLFNPTLEAVKFFYRRLTPKGKIVLHDVWLQSIRQVVGDSVSSYEELDNDLGVIHRAKGIVNFLRSDELTADDMQIIKFWTMSCEDKSIAEWNMFCGGCPLKVKCTALRKKLELEL